MMLRAAILAVAIALTAVATGARSVARAQPTAPTYREFIDRIRHCDLETGRGAPPPDAALIPSRLGEWNRCMAPVADRISPAQREALAAGMRSCNTTAPYAIRPGDNIACIRHVIRGVFAGPVDPRARSRMVGAEIAGRCQQRYPADDSAQLKCIRAGLRRFSASDFRDGDNPPPPAPTAAIPAAPAAH